MRLALSCVIVFIVMFTTSIPSFSEDFAFPASPYVVDVTKPPYNARGDGLVDDTQALQQAINESTGHHRLLHFPAGTYLISSTLTWPKKYHDHENWGFTYLSGVSPEKCILKLRNNTFTDPRDPKAMMVCGGFGSADWFHNYVENLTFDVGEENPAAIGLQFYSNNSGAIRNCRFLGNRESGAIGLDLAYRDMNGPLLVYGCLVDGFHIGVRTGQSVNSQVFENISLQNQTGIGFANEGQTISIRGFKSVNKVTALSTYGNLCLIDGAIEGTEGATDLPAVINYNGGRIFLRNVKTNGYGRALGDVHHTPDSAAAYRIQGIDKEGSLGPHIEEYCSHATTSLFDTPAKTLRLEVKDTPTSPLDKPSDCASVDNFGADPSGVRDSSEAIQRAIDSGAKTVFFPGNYNVRTTILIRGNVRRLIGFGGQINYGKGLANAFHIVNGPDEDLFIEHFAHIGGGIKVDSKRTLIVRSVSDCNFATSDNVVGAEWFFEDVVTHDLQLNSQKLWARQLDIENEGFHLRNVASDLWILGYKTERGGTLVDTRSGGRTEILGGFSYTTTAGKLAPMFVNDNSRVWTFFSEICYNGDPFNVLVREIQGNETREIITGAGGTWPYYGAK